jgi:hypothetical protein
MFSLFFHHVSITVEICSTHCTIITPHDLGIRILALAERMLGQPGAGDKRGRRGVVLEGDYRSNQLERSRTLPTMNELLSLSSVPQEVLEHVAFFTATDTFLGPPSSLLPLLLTSRQINASLSIAANHHLYADIFCHKFDTAAPMARLGLDRLTSLALADELRRRCVVLQRLRDRLDSTTHARHACADNRMSVYNVLSTAYIMMLENEGKNKRQLVEYGLIGPWIREFWFNPHGSSLAIYNIRTGQWPRNCPVTALGMWLFWFLLKIGELNKDFRRFGFDD